MSPEQEPQAGAPLMSESAPSHVEQVSHESIETKASVGTPLVPEEDWVRMRAKIAGAFKDSTLLSGKNEEWKAETGMGEQAWAALKIAYALTMWGAKHPLVAKRGLFEVFKKKGKEVVLG